MRENKKKRAMTLAEILLVVVVIAMVSTIGINSSKQKLEDYKKKLLCYSVYTTLVSAVNEFMVIGCKDSNPAVCPLQTNNVLPLIGNSNTLTTDGSGGLCQRFADLLNTIGTVDCSQTANAGTNFYTATPNFTTSNGMRFFNLGSNPVGGIYTIYVDIDSSKKSDDVTQRNAVYNEDVQAFTISTTGLVLPVYDSKAATDTTYLSAVVRYLNSDKTTYTIVDDGIPFRTAYCYATGDTTYPGYTTSCTQHAACTTNNCEYVLAKPKIFY